MALVNDYTVSNSINENKYNTTKLSKSKMHKLKQLLKPVFATILRNKKTTKNTYVKSVDSIEDCCLHCTYYNNSPNFMDENMANEEKEYVPEYDSAYESDQNDANELLEQQILDEINALNLDANVGVPVYFNHDQMEIVPIVNGQSYIPVHFAKTEAGTFFWTAMSTASQTYRPDDIDLCYIKSISGDQTAEEQVPCDRWAQA